MGDVNEGDAELALHVAQLLAHLDAQELVERRKRFVEQQHARLGDRGARQRDALLLAAGKLRRQPVRKFGQPDFFHHGVGGPMALGFGRCRARAAQKAMLSRTVRCGNSA